MNAPRRLPQNPQLWKLLRNNRPVLTELRRQPGGRAAVQLPPDSNRASRPRRQYCAHSFRLWERTVNPPRDAQ